MLRVQQESFAEWTKTVTMKKDKKIIVKMKPVENTIPEGEQQTVRPRPKLNKKLLIIGGGALALGAQWRR
jgi:UDP-N-acetylglucosamine:LPS N-acetylglucosamine transferase